MKVVSYDAVRVWFSENRTIVRPSQETESGTHFTGAP